MERITREQLNEAAAKVNNAVFYGTREMVIEAESKFQELLGRAQQ